MKTNSRYVSEIASYYKNSQWLYKYFWYSPESLGLHYGFWDTSTKSDDESIINQYRYVINAEKITKSMRVLDAGCGVGGASIYIAKHTGARLTGISITPEQVQSAFQNAKKNNVSSLTKFLVADYCHTPFPPASFDAVFGIESICYAYPKNEFLKEAYRILKSNGVLFITDGYSKRIPNDRIEKNIYSSFCRGFHLKELITYDAMTRAIRASEFKITKVEDKTQAVGHSLQRMKNILRKNKFLISLSRRIPLPFCRAVTDNAVSMRMSIEGIKLGLFGYYAHSAVKK